MICTGMYEILRKVCMSRCPETRAGAYRRYALLCLLGVVPLAVSAQVETPQVTADDKPESFFVDVITFQGSNQPLSRVDVFVQVGYGGLSFVKRDDRYYASYEATISITDSSNTLVTEKSWTEEIKGVSFEESVSTRPYNLTERIFTVQPGRYTITVNVTDRESKLTRRQTRRVLVSDYAHQKFALSDIMLISRVKTDGSKRTLVPLIGGNVGSLGDGFYTFFEAYNDTTVDTLRLVASVADTKGEVQLQEDTLESVSRGKNDLIMRINHSTLGVGDYVLVIRAYPSSVKPVAETHPLGMTSRPITIRWRGIPHTVKDLDLAIQQLRYIATDKEMDSLQAAKTPEEKQRQFLAFWKKRDPNPNTPRNEKMEDYYARVEYANKHFSHYIEGWKTDMGMVYIIFGPPSNVDRHPYDIDAKPYEIWSYYELNHQFIFVDESGFGDYRLINPIWDVWHRQNN